MPQHDPERALSTEERAQQRAFVRYSILRIGLPWAVLMGAGMAYRGLPPEATLGQYLRSWVGHAVLFFPFGLGVGWSWARGMWAVGFGRRLPK